MERETETVRLWRTDDVSGGSRKSTSTLCGCLSVTFAITVDLKLLFSTIETEGKDSSRKTRLLHHKIVLQDYIVYLCGAYGMLDQ